LKVTRSWGFVMYQLKKGSLPFVAAAFRQ